MAEGRVLGVVGRQEWTQTHTITQTSSRQFWYACSLLPLLRCDSSQAVHINGWLERGLVARWRDFCCGAALWLPLPTQPNGEPNIQACMEYGTVALRTDLASCIPMLCVMAVRHTAAKVYHKMGQLHCANKPKG